MSVTRNSSVFRRKYRRWDYLHNVPTIFEPFRSKNMDWFAEENILDEMDRAKKTMLDGMVTLRSVRQFRLQPAYKLHFGDDGVLPWTVAAAQMSVAFGIINYLYSQRDGERMIDRLATQQAFQMTGQLPEALTTHSHARVVNAFANQQGNNAGGNNGDNNNANGNGGGQQGNNANANQQDVNLSQQPNGVNHLVSPLDCFVNNGVSHEQIVNTLRTACNEVLSSVPSAGDLLSNRFFTLCQDLVTHFERYFSNINENSNATAQSITLYKLAQSSRLLRVVVDAARNAIEWQNYSGESVEINEYIDYTNWQTIVTDLWNAKAQEALSLKIREMIQVDDSDLIQPIYSLKNGMVLDMCTLRPDAYIRIFEAEKDVLFAAIDDYNKKRRRLERLGELPELLNDAYALELLGVKNMSDGEVRLANVIFHTVSENHDASNLFTARMTTNLNNAKDQVNNLRNGRLRDTLAAAIEVLDEFYTPCTYEAWAGCLASYSDAGQAKLIHRFHRTVRQPHYMRAIECSFNNNTVTNILTRDVHGIGLATTDGLYLDNLYARISGDDVIADNQGTKFSGDWDDLVGIANRLMGIFTYEVNKDGLMVDQVSRNLFGYTILPPADGNTVISTGVTSRREVSGRTFQLRNVTRFTNPDSNLVFFVRGCDAVEGQLPSIYENRIKNMVKSYVDLGRSIRFNQVGVELSYINPIFRLESNGAHFLQPYNDAVYLPHSFRLGQDGNRLDVAELRRRSVLTGYSIMRRLDHTFNINPYYIKPSALSLLEAPGSERVIRSSTYRGLHYAELNSRTNTLRVRVFTDEDSGMVTYARGDSYRDAASGRRLVYASFHDVTLNTSIGGRMKFLEVDGQILQRNEMIISPAMVTELRPLRTNRDTALSRLSHQLNFARNVSYTLYRTFIDHTDEIFGIGYIDIQYAVDLLTFTANQIQQDLGREDYLQSFGMMTDRTVGDFLDAVYALGADIDRDNVLDLMLVLDPVIGQAVVTNSELHPVIPISCRTDSEDKLNHYWGGGPLVKVSALTSINVDKINEWFHENYAHHLLSQMRNVVNASFIFGMAGNRPQNNDFNFREQE